MTRKVFHFYDKQRTVLPRLGARSWPGCDLIENHDAIQCDVTKSSSANTQVKRHPRALACVFVCVQKKRNKKRSLPHDPREKTNMLSVQLRHEAGEGEGRKKEKKKTSTEKMRRYRRAGHPHCAFASILIFRQDFLRAEQSSGCF